MKRKLIALLSVPVIAFVAIYGVVVVNWGTIWQGLKGEQSTGKDTALIAELKEKRSELARLETELAAMDAQILILQNQISELSDLIISKDATIEDRDEEITDLKQQISSLNTTVSQLNSNANSLQEQINALTNENSNKASEIELLNALVVNYLATIAGYENTITQLNSLIAYLENTIPDITIREEFVVSFYVDNSIWDIKITSGLIIAPAAPSGNWSFVGWSLDGESIVNVEEIQATTDINFYAIIDCEVRYIVNGETYATETVRQNSDLPLHALSESGFKGWSLDGETHITSTSIQINSNTILFALFGPISFAVDSWETIAANPGFYNEGDEKDIELTTGEIITVLVLGKNHDELSDGTGKASLSIGMKNLLTTTYRMSSTKTNAGGWDTTEMRTQTLPTIFSQLPTELQAIIKLVNKPTANNGSQTPVEIINSQDKLWCFSYKELFGGLYTYSHDGEGVQYEYWKTIKNGTDNADRVKYLANGTGGATAWWLRSTPTYDYGSFYSFTNNGSLYNTNANNVIGVCFGFCV